VIESRWTMSYLRGPLTKAEIRRLAPAPAPAPPPPPQASQGTVLMPAMGLPTAPQGTVLMPPIAAAPSPDGSTTTRPVLPPDVPQVFFPTTAPHPLYRPMLVGAARVHFEDVRTGLDYTREVVFVTPIVDGPLPVRWEDAKWAGGIDVRALGAEPVAGARFIPPPASALSPKSYALWSKELAKWLARTQGVARLKSAKQKMFSRPGEDERSFRARLGQLAREARDEDTGEVREKLASNLAAVEDKIRRKQDALAKSEAAAGAQRVDAALSVGGGIFDAFFGRRSSRNVVRGAVRTARSASRASAKANNVARDKEDLAALTAKHAELQREAQKALAQIATAHDPSTLALESVVTKPKKTGITIHLVALAWRADQA